MWLPCFFLLLLLLLLLLGPSFSHEYDDDDDDDDCQRCVVDKLRCVSFLEACQVCTLVTRIATAATAKHGCRTNRKDLVSVAVVVVVVVMMDSKNKERNSRKMSQERWSFEVLKRETRQDTTRLDGTGRHGSKNKKWEKPCVESVPMKLIRFGSLV